MAQAADVDVSLEYDVEEDDVDNLPEADEDYIDDPNLDDEKREMGKIPFKTLHSEPLPFDSKKRRCFLLGQKIDVTITDINRTSYSVLNPNLRSFLVDVGMLGPILYTIHLKHGPYEWTIRRRYKHFRHLHDQLVLFRAKLALPMPSRTHKALRQSIRKRPQARLPKFPLRPEAMVRTENMDDRKALLERYLQGVLRCHQYKNHEETLNFLEVSQYSFVDGLGAKMHEGMVKKRSGGRKAKRGFLGCINFESCTNHWSERWLLLKDTCIAYVHPDIGSIREVMLFDRHFKVENGVLATGTKHGLEITNMSRSLLLKCWTQRKAQEWRDRIEDAVKSGQRDYSEPNRYDSFAPVRQRSHAQWFADAATYMSQCADALENAKEEIFITDWWLSPEIYMKRPITEGDKWRLDVILKRKAAQGVKVFVMLFKEMEMALGINSYYTKQTLAKLHPCNVKILRHPNGINLWSHHEKSVIIDQHTAFVGGIDLCYGRWDTGQHKLTDLGSIVAAPESNPNLHGSTPLSALIAATSPGHHMDPESTPHKFGVTPMSALAGATASQSQGLQLPASVYDRSVSASSWPETESDHLRKSVNYKPRERHSIAAIDTGAAGEGLDELDETESSTKAASKLSRLPAIEGSNPDITELDANTEHNLNKSSDNDENKTAKHDEQVCDKTDSSISANSNVGGGCALANSSSHENETQDGSRPVLKKEASVTVEGTCETSSSTDKVDSGQRTSVNQVVIETKRGNQLVESIELISKIQANNNIDKNANRSNNAATEDSKSTDKRKQLIKQTSVHHDPVVAKKLSIKRQMSVAEAEAEAMVEKAEEQLPETDTIAKKLNEQLAKDLKVIVEAGSKMEKKAAKTADTKSQARKRWKNAAALVKENSQRTGASGDDNRETRSNMGSQEPTELNVLLDGSDLKGTNRDLAYYLSAFMTKSSTPKPSTPPPRRRLAQKAHDWKVDFKERFRRDGSKSVDFGHQRSSEGAFDFSFFQQKVDNAHIKPDVDLEEFEGSGTKVWVGKDYCNFIYKDFVDLDKPFTDFVDRTRTPRMPWHDIGAVVYGKSARDVARHFIQRWNYTKVEKSKTNPGYPLLLPKSNTRVTVPHSALTNSCQVNCQVLRSSSSWSAGIEHTELSIQKAYLDSIANAQHYIYIENQFFISISGHDQVYNQIAKALFDRIKRAHEKNETFRVYVVMPLLPAFEGELGTATGASIQAITHWNYASMCRGGKSIIERLAAIVPDPTEYISFYGLRTHEELHGRMVSELIYVHSKLMIVDDMVTIIGSANINDRSLLGNRDSELAIVVQDIHTTPVKMNGKDAKSGWYSGSLRKTLFKEHLGIPEKNDPGTISVDDPVSSEFYKGVWLKQASINTDVYDKVFRVVPTDKTRTFSQLHAYNKDEALIETDPTEALRMLERVQGNVVLMPLFFLSGENLQPSLTSKEGIAPTAIWT